MKESIIGKSILRPEGRGKVTGTARYIDDLDFPGLLHGVTVRSPIARGRIKAIHFGEGIPWDQFTVVTAKDIPGKNYVALMINDQPCLADEFVNHAEEAVVLLAHPDKYLLEEARRAVRIRDRAAPRNPHHRGFARKEGNHLGRGQYLQSVRRKQGRCR